MAYIRKMKKFALMRVYSPTKSKKIKKYVALKKVEKTLPKIAVNVGAVFGIIIGLVILVNCIFSGRVPKTEIRDVTSFRVPYSSVSSILELSDKYDLDFAEALTVFSLENNFFPEKTLVETDLKSIEKKYILNYTKIKDSYAKDKFNKYYELFDGIVDDIVYFPIPYGYGDYMYGDSFKGTMDEKSFGCDIFDRENIKGRLPVVSMTGGTVEKVGYSNSDGYNVTIKSPSGGEYYYSRFEKLSDGLDEGSVIAAGTLLGYMGEAKSASSVSLYIAISPNTNLFGEKIWINPYVFLRLSEEKSRMRDEM